MQKPLKILFVSHDASRTGAPLLLLSLIRWLKGNNDNIEIHTLILRTGPLVDEFLKFGQVSVWNFSPSSISLFSRALSKVLKRNINLNGQKKTLKRLKAFDPNVIYVNSVGSCEVIPVLKQKLKRPLLHHVHELEVIIQQNNLSNSFDHSIPFVDRFIAVSEMVRTNLVSNHSINNKDVDLIYEYIDTRVLSKKNIEVEKNSKIIIGGVGYVHWRKGIEFFLQVAKKLKERNIFPEFEFRWIGFVNERDLIYLNEDIKKMCLKNHVTLVGEKDNLTGEYYQMDILLLTSREDPFPVVALEAAFFSTPIICWNEGIGTKELVEKGCGFIVDYMDIEGMALAIEKILSDDKLKENLSKKARELSAQYDINIAGNRIMAIINSCIKV